MLFYKKSFILHESVMISRKEMYIIYSIIENGENTDPVSGSAKRYVSCVSLPLQWRGKDQLLFSRSCR